MRSAGPTPRLLDRRRKRFLILAVLLAAHPAWAGPPRERSVEVTAFAGYRLGGDLGNLEDAGSASVAEGSSHGIMIDIEVEEGAFVEFRYSRQQTELQARGTSFGPGRVTVTDMEVVHYFLGGTYQWKNESRFRPFASADLGVVRFQPGGYDPETRLAFAVGCGMKIPVADHFGLRFDARWVASWFDEHTVIDCRSPGQCIVLLDGTFSSQVEITGGVTFSF